MTIFRSFHKIILIQAERTDLQKKRDELTDVQKELAPRPGHGTIGHAVEVKTNSYEIKNRQQNRVELFQYEFRSLDFDELIKSGINILILLIRTN